MAELPLPVERVGGARLLVLDDSAAVAREAAQLAVSGLAEGLAQRGTAHLALTGGSSAVPFFAALRSAENQAAVDWSKVHLWWVDERFVPVDHPESNAGIAYRLLLGVGEHSGQSGAMGGGYNDAAEGDIPSLALDPANVHPIEVEETLADSEPVELAAQRYAQELERFAPRGRGGVPVLDVLMTGVGPDGHIFSLFPGSQGLAHDAPVALGVPAPEHVAPHIARVTLSARVLPAARLVLVMASGAGKAQTLADVLGDDRDVARWPAQAALLPNAVWLLDREAAAQLGSAR